MITMDNNNNYNTPTASIVAQFTVFTNSDGFYKLLNLLDENKLNVSAFTIQENDNTLVFKFIIGARSNPYSNDLNLVRSILNQYIFYFQESKVVRLSSFQNKCSLAEQYKELVKTLTVYNTYLGEDGSIIYETCCPTKTLKVLNKIM